MGNVYSSIGDGNSGGDVVGPASSTDNAIVRWDGTTGKIIQNSVIKIDDSGNLDNQNNVVGSSLSHFIRNLNTTNASSDARVAILTGGPTGGDPYVALQVSGAGLFLIGIDNSNNDVFSISIGASIGSLEIFQMTYASPTTATLTGSFTASASRSGSANFINVTNTSNTASSDAQYELQVAGTSAGDCKINMSVSGVPGVQWHLGLDNSDDDAFIIGEGSTFGADTNVRIDNAGIFELKKGFALAQRSSAVSDNVELFDCIVGCTDNSAARTFTLPSGASNGQTFVIKDEAGTAGTANAITIDTAGAELIDGAATATINSNYGSLSFYFDGTNYFVY